MCGGRAKELNPCVAGDLLARANERGRGVGEAEHGCVGEGGASLTCMNSRIREQGVTSQPVHGGSVLKNVQGR